MKYVGVLCNCTADANPRDALSPSIVNRVFLIDRLLRPQGVGLFLYSPQSVETADAVSGYTVEGDDTVAAAQPVPRINANWTYGTRKLIDKGMGYKRFKKWVKENEIDVYVPYEFTELVSNKQKAYEVVKEHDERLHPRTEKFLGSPAQVESFLAGGGVTFIKPRAGNRGNQIFVLRPGDAGCSMKYYHDGETREFSRLTVDAALGTVEVAAGYKNYVIQEGIESVRFEGSVFDIRAVMVNDGRDWHSLLETRLAPEGSDLSNVFQGGSIRVTEELLKSMYGDEVAQATETEIRRVSHRLAEYLESLYPGRLMELGFDFVLDAARIVHLVEVNSKPGVAGIGSEVKFFDWKAEDAPLYEKGIHPHVRSLAAFLMGKVEAAG